MSLVTDLVCRFLYEEEKMQLFMTHVFLARSYAGYMREIKGDFHRLQMWIGERAVADLEQADLDRDVPYFLRSPSEVSD